MMTLTRENSARSGLRMPWTKLRQERSQRTMRHCQRVPFRPRLSKKRFQSKSNSLQKKISKTNTEEPVMLPILDGPGREMPRQLLNLKIVYA